MPKVLVAAKAKSERAHPDSVQAKLRRQALDDALHEHELRPADLARMAGLPNANLIYNFLRGRTASLNTITWERLLPHFPRSNIGLLRGLSGPGESTSLTANERRLKAKMRRRASDQVARHISQVRSGLADLQQIAASCTQQLAVLEARFSDLQEKS